MHALLDLKRKMNVRAFASKKKFPEKENSRTTMYAICMHAFEVKRKVHTNPVFRSYIRKKMERIKKLKK
jgi:hypothetical protein